MALHELFIDGKSSADFGVYICGGGTWNTPKRKGSVVNVAGRNGSLWIDDGAWDNVTIKYSVIFNGNNREMLDAFTTWLASNSMGEHRIEDTLHERYYRIGRVDSNVSPRVVEKWNSSKFIFDIICRPEKFLKEGDNPIHVAPLGSCYIAGNPTYITQNSEAPSARGAYCTTFMAMHPKFGGKTYIEAYISGIEAGDECYFYSDDTLGYGEKSRFTTEYCDRVYPDANGHIRVLVCDDTSTRNKRWCSYRLAVISDSENLTIQIDQGNEYFVSFSIEDYNIQRSDFNKNIYTSNVFTTTPLIHVKGWSFDIFTDGLRLVGEDYRTARGLTPSSEGWEHMLPVDFYIDSMTKEIYYEDQTGYKYNYAEHVSILKLNDDYETYSLSPRFPEWKGVGQSDIYGDVAENGFAADKQDTYNDNKDFLFCSISVTPRYYEI